MEMERRKCWLSSMIKNSLVLPAKDIVANAASHLGHREKEKNEGLILVTLHKDMEACAGYADIQVMWEMIHSSRNPNVQNSRSRKQVKGWKLRRLFGFSPAAARNLRVQ